MNTTELNDRTGQAKEIITRELGQFRAIGVAPGTGWNEGVKTAFKEEESLPYAEFGVPGSELEVEGHSKALKLGEIDGRQTLIIGRVHPNENTTHPDLRQAMAFIIGALDDCLDGLIITNGVGTLQGPVGRERGMVNSLVQTALLDLMGWAQRGRKQEPIRVGDVALVDDVKTALLGQFTPLGAGEFVDFYRNGIHRDDDRYFDIARRAITGVQGHCPKAQARFILGPQFEGPADKMEFRAQGDDVVGMSGIQEILACTRLGVPFEQIVLATNGPFEPHTHEENQRTGRRNAEKAAEILRSLSRAWPVRD